MQLEIIGYIAGTLTTVCFVPQVWKIIRGKNAGGISLTMYLIFFTGIFCWLIYGIGIGNPPIILFNAIGLVLTAIIIYKLIRAR